MSKRKIALIILVMFIASCFLLTGFSGVVLASETPIKMKLSTLFPPDQPDFKLLEEFKQRVEKETNGQIQVTLYPANQLGDYTTVFEEVMRGTIDMCMNTIPGNYDQRLEILYLHYVAENYEQVKKYFGRDSYIFNLVNDICLELNVKLLGFHGNGFSGLGLVKEPNSPSDPKVSKDVLIRVPPMKVFKSWADDMNYQTVSVPYSELYTALQTKVAEGWSGGQPAINYFAFRDVIKYYYHYQTYFENSGWCMNLDLWKSLTPKQQEIIAGIVDDLSIKSIDNAQTNDEFYMGKMAEEGIKVITFTSEELKTIGDYTRKVSWPKLEDRLGKEVLDNFMKEYESE